MQEKAKKAVYDHIRSVGEDADFEVYVVWFCKTLQNFKVLLGTTLPEHNYYEYTYDGEQERAYLDIYKKCRNKVIPD